MAVITGLERLLEEAELQKSLKGNIGLLCHSASVTRNYELAIPPLLSLFPSRLIKLFGPQHGFLCNVQDNMVESQDFIHPYFQLPVHSLYSQTRYPTEEMLKNINTIVVDLQDVGTRVYTYASTLTMLMEVCGRLGVEVVVLDRPNPIGGEKVEGNILHPEYTSFVGRYPMPQRHGLTMGELAKMAQKSFGVDCALRVITMKNWHRSQCFSETGLPWVLPSPNLPTVEGTYTFVGTVLFEGTNISEGRGTTRSLEILGHPLIEPFSFLKKIRPLFADFNLEGFALRPLIFTPTFQKHQGIPCGGFQIHVTDKKTFSPWRLGQFLCRQFYLQLGEHFTWKTPPYEYEYQRSPIDLINGSEGVRHWVESSGRWPELKRIEEAGRDEYMNKRENILLYS